MLCTYTARRENAGQEPPRYTLRLQFDGPDPGESVLTGQSREDCAREIAAARAAGYEIVSRLALVSAVLMGESPPSALWPNR